MDLLRFSDVHLHRVCGLWFREPSKCIRRHVPSANDELLSKTRRSRDLYVSPVDAPSFKTRQQEVRKLGYNLNRTTDSAVELGKTIGIL